MRLAFNEYRAEVMGCHAVKRWASLDLSLAHPDGGHLPGWKPPMERPTLQETEKGFQPTAHKELNPTDNPKSDFRSISSLVEPQQ